jgi:hypothetical protein
MSTISDDCHSSERIWDRIQQIFQLYAFFYPKWRCAGPASVPVPVAGAGAGAKKQSFTGSVAGTETKNLKL